MVLKRVVIAESDAACGWGSGGGSFERLSFLIVASACEREFVVGGLWSVSVGSLEHERLKERRFHLLGNR